jgi:prepilin signal peptidase PulO-like enzyme (type II secretory pathway)
MSESSDTLPALGRLTPDLAGEVRRNLIVWLAVMVAVAAVFSGLFAIAVDPGLSGVAGGVAVVMFGVFLTFLVPLASLLLGLVYLFDCWPTMLRGRLLRERYGVAAGELDGSAWRRAMGSGGFWAAAARGAVVGWAFLSAAVLTWWGLTGKWSLGLPSAILVVLAAQFAARAWFVRQAVARAGVLGPEMGAKP